MNTQNTMKGIILKQDEILTLRDAGKVTVWRDIKLRHGYRGMNKEWASVNSDGHGGWIGWYPHPVTDEETRRFYPNGGGFKCPYATPGEVRFVRETWRHHSRGVGYIEYKSDLTVWCDSPSGNMYQVPTYENIITEWRSSVNMPQWASRYTVKCTSVTVEKRGDVWQWGIELEKADK